jgi:hypothetical protein
VYATVNPPRSLVVVGGREIGESAGVERGRWSNLLIRL